MRSLVTAFMTALIAGLVCFFLVLGRDYSVERAALAGGLGFATMYLILFALRGRQ